MNPKDKYTRVICQYCGPQFLHYDDYMMQMNIPDATWRCPKCRHKDCQFDDAYYERNFDDTMEDYK